MVALHRFVILLYFFKNFYLVQSELDYPDPDSPGFIGNRIRLIFPGTKWCGAGDIARNEEELGFFKKTDECCREHDHCPYTLSKGMKKYGLRNLSYYTRLHCNCDEKFYNCLKRAKNFVSTKVGYLYFSVLRPQCFVFKDDCLEDNNIDCDIEAEWRKNKKF